MSRLQRVKSESGCYHVMLRGNEKKEIFRDEEDKLRFIDTAYRMKCGENFYLHAFCLMDNHIHLMISEGKEDIAKVMKKVTVSYVFYFNKKYKRVGHLFQDRFKSEVVTEDSYVLSLARYIHQNPVKAGLVKKPEDYRWSSYNAYLNEKDYLARELDAEIVLGLLSEDENNAKKLFVEYMNKENQDSFIEITEKDEVMNEEEARELYNKMFGGKSSINDLEKADLLKEYKRFTNLSIRKIAEISGVNKDKLCKIYRE